jgi:uncharacterized protein (DUF2147 family)
MSASKKYIGTILFTLLISFSVIQRVQAQTDKLEGLWYNDIKSAKILINRAPNGKFEGRIVWLSEPLKDGKPKTDDQNPDDKLRNRPIIGLPILMNFVKDGEDKYTDGTIYDPKNGKTYACNITYKGNTLSIRGYIGISLFGRTTVWERVN